MAEDFMRELGFDQFTCRSLGEGIHDPPQNPKRGKDEMPVIPQTPEEKKFGNEAVERGLRSDTRAGRRSRETKRRD